MAIITHTDGDVNMKYAYLNIFPDQFKKEKDKLENDTWIKNSMDFFATKSYQQYRTNRDTFAKNYDLLNGKITAKDFDEGNIDEVKDFMSTIVTKEVKLPSYVKHYPIINPPINTLIGELSKRPDIYKAKAFDEDSQSEELSAKTAILEQYVTNKIKQDIIMKAKLSGQELDNDTFEQMTEEELQNQLTDYTSMAERWANHVLECQKIDFSMKELSEDGFKDLLAVTREYFHIYEDCSKLGFNVELLNPKNVCILTTPNKKYTSDPSGRSRGSHAVSIVDVMEISEIIERIPELTKDEIDHLRKGLENFGIMDARESNLGKGETGPNTIQYDTYNRLLLQERMMVESDMADPGNDDPFGNLFGLTSGVSAFGYKYVVVTSYWQSKELVGQLDYIDEMGNEQSIMVDENYVESSFPEEIKVTWGWRNRWYRGVKVGPDVYHIAPLKILNYCPVIGLINNGKNTAPKSFVDLMKPFQMLYNVCMNQLFNLLKKEKGNIGVVNIRRIPRVKDGDGQDDIDVWEAEAEARGIMFDDDSPENLKAPVSNTTVIKNVDLTRTQEIQSRYNLAVQLRNECWKLVGISDQRIGEMTATETATNTNTAIAQSYAQTEPLFAAHQYLMNQVYQAIIDASLYTQSQLPTSSISYITNEGEAAFIEIQGNDLSLRDIKVFIASRPEDQKLFNEIRQLAQPLLQNGGSFLEVIELYSTNSIRQMKQTFRKLKKEQQEQADRENQLKQEQLKQQQEQFEQETQQAVQEFEETREDENYNKELDRINKKEVALINQLGRNPLADADNNHNGEADALEIVNMQMNKDKVDKDHKIKLLQIQQKEKERQSKIDMEREKLATEKEKMANDLKMRKLEIKQRGQQKAAAKKSKK